MNDKTKKNIILKGDVIHNDSIINNVMFPKEVLKKAIKQYMEHPKKITLNFSQKLDSSPCILKETKNGYEGIVELNSNTVHKLNKYIIDEITKEKTYFASCGITKDQEKNIITDFELLNIALTNSNSDPNIKPIKIINNKKEN